MADITDRSQYEDERVILQSLLTDITNLRTAFNTAMTKLNADAWVTDTDYAAAPALTTTV